MAKYICVSKNVCMYVYIYLYVLAIMKLETNMGSPRTYHIHIDTQRIWQRRPSAKQGSLKVAGEPMWLGSSQTV